MTKINENLNLEDLFRNHLPSKIYVKKIFKNKSYCM